MGGLPDNYFWDEPVNTIPTRVATITLAAISAYSGKELLRVGWYLSDSLGNIYLNPAIEKLYELTSAGVWIARTNASGLVKEANSDSLISLVTYLQAYGISDHVPTVIGTLPAVPATNLNYHRRIAQIPLTEAGGAIAATTIVTGIASYKAHCIIKKLYYPEGSTDASHTITIASEAGGGITGPTSIIQGGTAFCFTYFGAIVAGTPTDGILIYNTTADKDITIAAADLTTDGSHHTYYIEVEYWYEA